MDQFFNYDVAARIYDTISKMDADEAEMFTRFFVYEVHKQDIEDNRRTVMRHAEDIQKSLVRDLPDDLRELISKDDGTNYFDKYNREQPRDGSGRWVSIEIPGAKIAYGRQKNKTKRAVKVDRSGGYQKGGNIDITGALNQAGENTSAFADRWNSYSDNDASTNERTYRRVAAGARLLGTLPSDQAKLASAAGQFAGQFGPEAERVIGPAARRTAYRYRGTERMPDAELGKIRREALQTQRKTVFSQKEIDERKPLTPEQRMDASEKAAQVYLMNRLPKKNLAELQRQSGKLPPSEGVIISPTGEIVTQAVGYNEDHYLPFNLKNLKGLKGGSYVRTRSQGGLTSEDIYTGLLSGARSVTVVSRSGTFTLDFEDDLRGGRRYSDKARQMVGRYAQTLDAVQSEKVTRRKLSPDERAEIRTEVEREYEGQGYTQSEIEGFIKKKETEYQQTPQLTPDELNRVNAAAKEAADNWTGHRGSFGAERVPSDPQKRYAFFRSAFMDRAMEDKSSRNYRLDADGYDAAMKALKEQFPYFIKDTSFRPHDDREMVDRGADTGYVRPRYNRPKSVQAGYFDEEITGRGKFNASELHYQNDGVRNRNRSAQAGESEEQTVEGKKNSVAASRQKVREARNVAMAQAEKQEAVRSLADVTARFAAAEESAASKYPLLTRYSSKPDITGFSEKELDTLVEEIRRVGSMLTSEDNRKVHPAAAQQYEDAMKSFDRADTKVKSRVAFDPDKWTPGVVSAVPSKFNDKDPQFASDQEPAVYNRGWAAAVHKGRLENEIKMTDTDEQLRRVEKKWGDVYAATVTTAEGFKQNDLTLIARGKQDLLTALGKADFPENAATRLDQELENDNLDGLNRLAEESKRKALAVVEARSVKSAAGDKLGQNTEKEASKPDKDTPIKGEITSSEEKNYDTLTLLRNAAKGSDQRIAYPARALVRALHEGDEEKIVEALDNLPDELAHFRQKVLEELNQKDD